MTQSNVSNRSKAGHDIFSNKSKKKEKEAKTKVSPAILLGEHNRYQIKSGWLAGTFVARAFPKPPTNARGMIAEATGATEAAAIAALHEAIDARENRRTDERREEPRTGVAVPSTEEYVEAIRQVTLSQSQRAMLSALSLAGEDGMTGSRMTYAAGYKSETSANRSLMAAGHLIADYLSVEPASADDAAASDSAALLGYRGEMQNDADPGNWILHAELREAVRQVL